MDALIKGGCRYVADADLKGYFDSIPHERLMERVRARIADGSLLDLLEGWLKQEIMSGMESWTPTEGSPQGAVISPLLANIYLHPLDELMAGHGYKMVRYADDFVVLCQSREEAEAALALIRAWVAENGLSLHPDKTHIGNFRKKGGGFSFLGYSFEGKRRHVRKKSLDKLKDRIRQKTKRTRGESLKQVIAGLNPVLRGWFEYFKHAHHPVFKRLDGLVRRRLRASCASRKSAQALAAAWRIKCAGPTPSSRTPGCSRFTRPGRKRDAPDEETANWRAVCGKTARTVPREGRQRRPYPYQHFAIGSQNLAAI